MTTLQKTLLIIGAVVVIGGAVALVTIDTKTTEPVSEDTVTATSTPEDTSTMPDIKPAPETHPVNKIDLSKLQGKDRFYSEEEGKYENLGDEEQKLLTHLFCAIQPRNHDSECAPDAEDFVRNGIHRLLALHNDHAVIWYSSQSGAPSTIKIFDLKNLQETDQFRDSDVAYGTDYMIRWRNTVHNDSDDVEFLELYRPGMSQFVKIPNTDLFEGTYKQMSESDMLPDRLVVEFSGENITTHVFHYIYNKTAESIYDPQTTPLFKFYELESEDVMIFDISNLP